MAKLIHPLPADAGKHKLACFQVPAFFVQFDGPPQEGKLLLFDPSKLVHLSLLRGAVLGETPELGQAGFDLRGRLLVRV